MDHQQQWLQRISCEYLEMPGLGLSLPQAQRLWSLDAVECALLLDTLLTTGFLEKRADGRYVRVNEGPRVRPRLDIANVPSLPKNRPRDAA